MNDSGAHQYLRLVVDALARQDEAEAKRLYESCPDGSLQDLDAALDKVISFLVVNLLLTERRQLKAGENGPDSQAGQAVANLLAAADTFCAGIAIPLTQLAAINPQLGDLVASLSPLGANRQPDPERVEDLVEVLRGCWEADY